MARSFDGTDDEIVLANESNFDFNFNTIFTICAWVKPTNTSHKGVFVSKHNLNATPRGWVFSIEDGGTARLQFFASNSSGVNFQAITTNEILTTGWQHIVMAYIGSSGDKDIKFYRNAVLQARTIEAQTLGNNSLLNDVAVRLGNDATSPHDPSFQPYNGLMANVTIHDKELNANEIIHNMRLGYVKGNLKAFLPLHGANSPEADFGGLKNNGTVTGAILANHAPVGNYLVPFSLRNIG